MVTNLSNYLINDNFLSVDLSEIIYNKVDLFIIDPPYGNIIKDGYDRLSTDEMIDLYNSLLDWCSLYSSDGATIYLFGGIGTKNNRPFLKFLSTFEDHTDFKLHNLITWKKRRGYGTKYNYLFTREEIAMLVYKTDKPKIFNVPYLDEERSDEWKKRLKTCSYSPHSNKMRRSNVFADINELFRSKLVTAQKPEKLIEVLVETSSNENSIIVDPMAGSGTTGVVCNENGRSCIMIENDSDVFKVMCDRLNNHQ